MAKPSTRDELASALASTLTELGRRNEIRLGYVRISATVLGSVLGWTGYLHPRLWADYPRLGAPVALVSTVVVGVQVLFWWSLHRGWYRSAVSYGGAVIDAVSIAAFHLTVIRTADASLLAVFAPTLSATCAVYAASGGMRATSGGAVWTAFLAMVLYLTFGLLSTTPPATICSVEVFLLTSGFLGYWMNQLSRSAVAGALGRVALERFLPRRVLEGALVDPLALVATPRTLEATVLISDLRGFTAFAESLPPAEVLAFLNEIHGELAEAVRHNGGVVDKFMGDGMLAVFGAPEANPDHAQHAVMAAADAVAAMGRLNARRAARRAAPVRIGIGVHSGQVVSGCLGSGRRLEFTVIGDTVNTAARLEALTKEKQVEVLVSGETARRAGAHALAAMGSVAIRGRAAPLEVFGLGEAAEAEARVRVAGRSQSRIT